MSELDELDFAALSAFLAGRSKPATSASTCATTCTSA